MGSLGYKISCPLLFADGQDVETFCVRAGAGPASCATSLRSVLVSCKAARREVNDDTAQPLALTAQWPVSGEGFVGSNGARVFVLHAL